jgi:hypothetical protein
MRRTQILFTIQAGFLAMMVAASQAAPQTAVSPELRAHVQAERFQIVTSIRGLPLGVRIALQTVFGSSSLDIAEPGTEFQLSEGNVNTKQLPIRRLVSAGCSYEHCLVYYERGGTSHTWRLALFHWTPDATRLEGGGIAASGLTTIEDMRSAFLSGTLKDPAGLW